ncbi:MULTISPECIES: restriction endonuclease subunit S [unclassified Nostoc]|uniref:restriction endonuclease subunit S n=1 Tax=unclassified Nostoc TaxID=2593658 RepID=UPI001E070F56|nr:restriction endonuclease subunit S [Nostoc sp. JL23]MBN3879598.1 restriction endonuclease subunit S [Nostoc sp. JL23]
MVSTIISINIIKKGRFIAEQFLLPDKVLIEKINKGKFTLKTISKIGKVRGGKRLPSNSRYVLEGIRIPYVRSTDIKELRVDFKNVVFISPEQEKFILRYPLKYLDVVISIAGTIGTVGLIDEYIDPCYFNENLARITEINELNPLYLAVYLNSKFGQAYIKYFTGGAVQPKLSLESINKIAVPCPPPSVQKCIAQIMQNTYATRQNKLAEAKQIYRKIEQYILGELGIDLTKLQSQHRSIKSINSIAGGRFDFEAVVTLQEINFGLMKPVLLGEVVSQVNQRITPVDEYANENINYIGLGNIASNTGELIDFFPVRGEQILSSSPKFEPGDILFGRMRPYLNKVWLAEFNGVCSGEAVVLRPNKQKVDPIFLQGLLLSQITLNQVVPLQSGTSLPRVSASDVLSIKLPIPEDLNKQREISAEISRRRAEGKRLRVEAENLVTEAKTRVERMILGEEEVT